MKYHREGKNHLLLLHLIIPTKKWSRAYIFKYQLTHLDFNESKNDKPPLWCLIWLSPDDLCIVTLDFCSMIICHLTTQITLFCTGGVTDTGSWDLGGCLLPNGGAITSHQFANGVNCHTHHTCRVGLNRLSNKFILRAFKTEVHRRILMLSRLSI